MGDLWFFLSYARGAAAGEDYLKRFYRDLAREIRITEGPSAQATSGEIGFMDSESVEPGDWWPDAVSAALGVTRTLVCMYSRQYFNSEYCGKEFAAFRSRLERSGVAHAPATLVIPVLWDAPDRLPDLPDAVSDIEYLHDRLGDVYARNGLRYLMKLNKHRDRYRELVGNLAEAVIGRAKETSVPRVETLAPLREVRSAWEPERAEAPGASPTPIRLGPQVARFVYVAGRPHELKGIRRRIEAYGFDGGRDWQPYCPDDRTAIGVLSQRIASDENLHYETIPVDDELVRELERAEEEHVIVVIVVDPWTVGVDPYRRHMTTYDKRTFVNCALMVPWNDRDSETAQYHKDLDATLNHALSRHFVVDASCLHNGIGSLEELQRLLGVAINEIRQRIIRHVAFVNRPSGSGDVRLPQVQGPWVASL